MTTFVHNVYGSIPIGVYNRVPSYQNPQTLLTGANFSEFECFQIFILLHLVVLLWLTGVMTCDVKHHL